MLPGHAEVVRDLLFGSLSHDDAAALEALLSPVITADGGYRRCAIT